VKEKENAIRPSADVLRTALEEQLSRTSESCTDCGICINECDFLKKHGSPKIIAARYDAQKKSGQVMPFECSLCSLCTAVCPEGLDPREMFIEMRREAVERGKGIFPEHSWLLRHERIGMSRFFSLYALPEGCRHILFPGCAFPGIRPGTTRKLFDILSAEDPNLGILLECCGRISDDLGRAGFSSARLAKMQEFLIGNGVDEVIVVCPNCYDMFRDYAKDLKVSMIYEKLPKDVASNQIGGDALLHDPCGARFNSNCHDMVRFLLADKGIKVKELAHTRQRTLCCGNGAGIMSISPGLSETWLKRIAVEASGRVITTYCAGCSEMFNKAFKSVHVLDVLLGQQGPSKKLKVSRPPFTYLNRMMLKRYFKKRIRGKDEI
jgi:Fe-S oxidoreductase